MRAVRAAPIIQLYAASTSALKRRRPAAAVSGATKAPLCREAPAPAAARDARPRLAGAAAVSGALTGR